METHAFGFRLRANAPEGQKQFPISFTVAIYSPRPRSMIGGHRATVCDPSLGRYGNDSPDSKACVIDRSPALRTSYVEADSTK